MIKCDCEMGDGEMHELDCATMEGKPQTTPTPWVRGEYDGTDVFTDESKRDLVARFASEHDARLAVRAVNGFSALLEVAEYAAVLECVAPDSCLHCDAVKAIAEAGDR